MVKDINEKLSVGSRVRVSTKTAVYEGVVLPRPTLFADGMVSVKLDSGYNVGIAHTSITDVVVLATKKTKDTTKLNDGSVSTVQKEIPIDTQKEKEEQKSTPPTKVKKKRRIRLGVLACGGTITSRLDYETGAVKDATTPAEVFAMVPDFDALANVVVFRKVISKDSGEIEIDDFKVIAKHVYELLVEDNVDAILVLHGTDTLHYTTACLSFMLKNINKPVLFVYSQRSTDRASTDAIVNIQSALHLIKSARTQVCGVFAVGHASSHDDVCVALRGVTMRKHHASRRDAFVPINDVPVAYVVHNKDGVQVDVRAPTNASIATSSLPAVQDAPILVDLFEKKIAFITYVPGLQPDVLDWYVKQGYTGVVISFLGLGQIAASDASNNWIPTIQRAIGQGVIVCAVAQTIHGALQPHVYATGRILEKAGVLFLGSMLAETAYVKLGCALGRWSSQTQIKKFMLTNIAGELGRHQSYEMYDAHMVSHQYADDKLRNDKDTGGL